VIIRVPASTANLGPGFDVLACALTLYAEFRLRAPSATQEAVDHRHPASQAFHDAGGEGPLWVSASLPMGRGLGASAAMRVGGVTAALVQRYGPQVDPRHPSHGVLARVSALEGHGDNAAASLFGGLVVTVAGEVVQVPLPLEPVLVLWVPTATTPTSQSRRRLPSAVPFDDAVFNLGRSSLLVAALAAGRWDVLHLAVQDRLHQDARLGAHPASAAAMHAALDAGALGAWLSGSGPAVACWCRPDHVEMVCGALPEGGRVVVLNIDNAGVVIDVDT
jgi:homoserine kinase